MKFGRKRGTRTAREPTDIDDVVRGGGPAVEGGAETEFDVEDFLAEMFVASGNEGRVRMGDVVRKLDVVGEDIGLVASYVTSRRFLVVFYVDGEYLIHVSRGEKISYSA